LDRFWNRLTSEPADKRCSKKFVGQVQGCTNTCPNPGPIHPIGSGAFRFKNVLLFPKTGRKPVITSELTDGFSPKKSCDLTFRPSSCGPNFRPLARSVLNFMLGVLIGASCSYSLKKIPSYILHRSLYTGGPRRVARGRRFQRLVRCSDPEIRTLDCFVSPPAIFRVCMRGVVWFVPADVAPRRRRRLSNVGARLPSKPGQAMRSGMATTTSKRPTRKRWSFPLRRRAPNGGRSTNV
jgi:hypothetical protein